MIAAASPTLREFYEKTYRPLRLANGSEGTHELYLDALNRVRQCLGRDPRLTELDDVLVGEVMAHIMARGRSAQTANRVRRHVLALWRFAKRRQLIYDGPDVEALRTPKRVPRAWTLDDVSRMLAQAAQEKGTIGPAPASLWWRALILLLYDTGLRISAALQLAWGDLQADPAAVLARAETQKQDADQWLPISGETLPALGNLRACHGGERIFCWPRRITTARGRVRAARRKFKQLLLRAGLPYDRLHLFHCLRRTHASYVKSVGGDPTADLGHSSAQVTRAYLDPRIVQLPRWVDQLPRPSAPPPIAEWRQGRLFE